MPSPRFSVYGQKDTQWQPVGDYGWKGIDMKHDPGQVPEGYLIRAENKRLTDGKASTRGGITWPGDFNPVFANKIIGSGIYSNPNGDQVMLVATLDETYVWALQFGKDPVKVNLFAGQNTGTNPNGLVTFVQAFDKVMLLRLPVATPLIWNGITGNALGNTFDPVSAIAPVEPTKVIPPEYWMGQPFENRILLYDPYLPLSPFRDQFIMTDVNTYTQYDDILAKFRINSGEADLITCILPYFKKSVIVFMINSVHMLEDFTVDPFKATQRMLNSRLGSVSVRLPFMDGQDIIFLSRGGAGFYRISEVITEEVGALPRPISWLIQPVIDRINWDVAALWACSEGVGDLAYFSVPLDGATGGCNALVVYNTVTREWESAPDWFDDPSLRLNALHVTLYDGQQKLFGIDYAARRVYVLGVGVEDEINGDHVPVHDRMATRGYGHTSFNRFLRVTAGIRTYNPAATVSSRTDGVNELKHLASITKDKSRFYVHGRGKFDIAIDDANEPRREDYSVADTNSAIEDFEGLPDGPLAFIPSTPLLFTGDKQETVEKWQIRSNGRWCSIEIENTSGQLDVTGILVDAIPSQEGVKTLA